MRQAIALGEMRGAIAIGGMREAIAISGIGEGDRTLVVKRGAIAVGWKEKGDRFCRNVASDRN